MQGEYREGFSSTPWQGKQRAVNPKPDNEDRERNRRETNRLLNEIRRLQLTPVERAHEAKLAAQRGEVNMYCDLAVLFIVLLGIPLGLILLANGVHP